MREALDFVSEIPSRRLMAFKRFETIAASMDVFSRPLFDEQSATDNLAFSNAQTR